MPKRNFDNDLKAFSLWCSGHDVAESTKRKNITRIKELARKGIDVYRPEEYSVYQYCERKLQGGMKRRSLQRIIDDFARWLKFIESKYGYKIGFEMPHYSREESPEPWVPTPRDIQKLLEECENEFHRKLNNAGDEEHRKKWFRVRCEIEIMAYGGLRAGEVCMLNLSNLTGKGMEIVSEKRERDRKPALPSWVLAHMNEYVENYRIKSSQQALFTTLSGRISSEFLRKEIKEAGLMAGLPRLHPHALRHFCATFLLSMNVNIRKIQQQLGHKDVKTTQQYTHLGLRDTQEDIYVIYEHFFRDEENEGGPNPAEESEKIDAERGIMLEVKKL
ncbi:MAG: site-specific integrase [Thermoplasmataceae archaeon]|jgi:integrase